MHKNNICISVIVPIYNAEKYLVRCIESIVEQTYSELEIILVNDGSTDESPKICEEFGKRDERIRIIHKENGGPVSARTVGVKNATGEYVTFVDADDYIDINTYEILMKKMDSDDIDILLYGLMEDYEEYSVLKKNRYQAKVYERNEIESDIFPSMVSYGDFFDAGILPNLVCKIIKRSFWSDSHISVSEDVRIGEDADASYQLLANAKRVQILDDAPYHYCKRYDSVNWESATKESLINLESDMEKAFRSTGIYEIMKSQLKEYMAFVTLLKRPKEILDGKKVFKKGKMALYGAGGFGQAVYETYKEDIVAWVDRDYQKYASLGLPVESVEYMQQVQEEYDQIFIAILNTRLCNTIREQLIESGISKPIVYFDM